MVILNSISTDAYVFCVFVSVGILVGLLFDLFRISRKSFKTTDVITYIEDIIFWILTGILILYTVFKFNNGEIRGFIFLGIILGTIFYLLLFSKVFINISVKIINIIKKILIIIFKIIIYPIKLILKPITLLINKINDKVIQNGKKLINFKNIKVKKKDFKA